MTGGNQFQLPPEQQKICDLIRKDPSLSVRNIAKMLGIRYNTANKQVAALKSKGIVTRVGGTRGIWRIASAAE